MHRTLHIRSVRDEDFEAIASLTNIFIRSTAIHFGTQPVTPDELRSQWHASRERYPFLVAILDGTFAGYAKASVWRARPAYDWNCESGIYVEPQMQGCRIGKAQYRVLEEELVHQGFHVWIAGITLPNAPSVRLHESCGLRHVGTFEEAGWKLGAWHAVGFWRKQLRPTGAEPTPLRPVRQVARDIHL